MSWLLRVTPASLLSAMIPWFSTKDESLGTLATWHIRVNDNMTVVVAVKREVDHHRCFDRSPFADQIC